MSHKNIDATIKQLQDKAKCLRDRLKIGGHHYSGLDPSNCNLEEYSQIPRVRQELADTYDALAHAWQEKGDKGSTNYYFDKAKTLRK